MKIIKLLLISSMTICSLSANAYDLRNTYPSKLICSHIKKANIIFRVLANTSKDMSKVPSTTIMIAGKYECKTADNRYKSVCELSDFQPIATFNINDGSVSCTTPEKIK